MKRFMLLALLALFLAIELAPGFVTFSEPQKLDVLIIDETKTLEESFCVELLARAMIASNLFDFRATFEIPLGLNTSQGKYELIVIIPERVRQVWLVTADLPIKLPEPTRQGLALLRAQVSQVYGAGAAAGLCLARRAVGVNEDFAPALYGTLFSRHGWLKPADGRS